MIGGLDLLNKKLVVTTKVIKNLNTKMEELFILFF